MGRTPLLLVICSCLFSFPYSQFADGQTKTVIYSPSNEIIQNPERGMFQLEATGMVEGQITPYERLTLQRLQTIRRTHSLIFRYFGLKQWRTVDLPDSVLQWINNDFTAIRTAGLKCIPRFCYSATIGEPDATLATILRHLDQLRPILRANKDVIAAMQAGFIGAWGEWHSSTNGNESVQNMQTIMNKILDVLPPERMVQVRYPRHKQQILSLPFDSTSAITPQQAFTEIALARIGHHNDCFLASADDAGTYWRNNRLDTALAKPYLWLDDRFVPMGGETCRSSSFAACPNAVREMARLRWSYLNDGYNPNVINGFISGGCYDEIQRKLGYRFSLLRSEFTASGQRMGKFNFSMTVTNTGWASPYNPRHVELCLRNPRDGRIFSARLPVDPRRWQARDTVQVNVAIGIPASMPAGSYTVLINFPDPEPSLHARPDYSIRLANQNTWEPNTGYNNLLDSVATSATTSNDPYTGTLWFQEGNVTQVSEHQPERFFLSQNYPNPFNPSTRISFSVRSSGFVSLKVFDVLGREVKTLVYENLQAGSYETTFDAAGLASGAYFYRLQAGDLSQTKQLLLLR